MRGLVLLAALLLAACGGTPSRAAKAAASTKLAKWHLASGKPPTRPEFAALVAACQDHARTSSRPDPLESCLEGLGLRHAAP